ncbi:MAG: ORF6C domain-containing protein [Anaerolineales bacterium]|nr:ORF6C domain-containing protein [Anaerolineales bacterium]
MSKNALVPIVQKDVAFYEDTVTAVLVNLNDEDHVYVPLRPICDYLGLSYTGQRDRIRRDPVLSEHIQQIRITRSVAEGSDQEMVCLALKFLPGWLFGISVSRVKEELRDKIIRYQREGYDVLWEAFQENRLTGGAAMADLLKSDTPAAQAYKMAAAIMKMAQQQLLLEAELDSHASKLWDHEKRLEEIEAQLGDSERHITADQAMQVSQAVKTIAMVLGKKTGRNEYGSVYGQLYREFGITSYKQLPAHKFEAAMKWLTAWYQRITGATGDELPF